MSNIDPVVLSFAYVGCNRVGYHTYAKHDGQTNASTANLPALKRIFTELTQRERTPDLFFFLGDMVEGLDRSTDTLAQELAAWFAQYKDPTFSPVHDPQNGIELVAVTGNHEMLYYDENYPGPLGSGEFPLAGATETWLQFAESFMPSDRWEVTENRQINQATFSFVREGVGFVVMNTDTYNDPQGDGHGREGMIPAQWVNSQVNKLAQADTVSHVFVLGHRPYYVGGQVDSSHSGFPDGGKIWDSLQANGVVAMLSAHQHNYARIQPGAKGGTYQIVAGNGGSPVASVPGANDTYFGYSIIDVHQSGAVKHYSLGWEVGNPYDGPSPQRSTALLDSVTLTWQKNPNVYSGGVIDSAYLQYSAQ